MKRLLIFGLVLTASAAQAQETPPPHEVGTLIRSLNHNDVQIRTAAARLLAEKNVDSSAALLDILLDRASGRKQATFATLILMERYQRAGSEINEQGERQFQLADPEAEQLEQVAQHLADPSWEDWRWYLAASLIDEFAPTLLEPHLDTLAAAMRVPSPLQQFAAIRAIYHLGPQAHSENVTAALLDLLRTGRQPFHGIYLRDFNAIEQNRVAFAIDNRVYRNSAGGQYYDRTYRYYCNDDLLICDALFSIGAASFDDIGHHLASLALTTTPVERGHFLTPATHSASVQIHAAQLLTRLGSQGQAIAAETLNNLLLDDDLLLIRRLAGEYPSLVAAVPEESLAELAETFHIFLQLGPDAQTTIPGVLRLLKNSDSHARISAAHLLARIGETAKDESIAALRQAAQSERLITGPSYQAMISAINILESNSAAPAE